METKTLYTLEKSKLVYDPSIPGMIFKFRGFMVSSEFRTFLNKALELIKEKKQEHEIFGWVVNLIESDVILGEDMQWAANDFNFRAYQAGLRYVAFALPEDDYSMAGMNAETYIEIAQSKTDEEQMTMRMYRGEESAKVWLKEALKEE